MFSVLVGRIGADGDTRELSAGEALFGNPMAGKGRVWQPWAEILVREPVEFDREIARGS